MAHFKSWKMAAILEMNELVRVNNVLRLDKKKLLQIHKLYVLVFLFQQISCIRSVSAVCLIDPKQQN